MDQQVSSPSMLLFYLRQRGLGRGRRLMALLGRSASPSCPYWVPTTNVMDQISLPFAFQSRYLLCPERAHLLHSCR